MITLEDKIAIQELVARFAHCSDYCDWKGLASLYSPEIITEFDNLPIRYEGIDAQIEHARESDRQASGKNRHLNFNLFVEEAGGEIVARYYFLNANAGRAPMAPAIVVSGRMNDTVTKTADGWKIKHRLVSFDQSFDLAF